MPPKSAASKRTPNKQLGGNDAAAAMKHDGHSDVTGCNQSDGTEVGTEPEADISGSHNMAADPAAEGETGAEGTQAIQKRKTQKKAQKKMQKKTNNADLDTGLERTYSQDLVNVKESAKVYGIKPEELACLPHCPVQNPHGKGFTPMKFFLKADVIRLAFRNEAVVGGCEAMDNEDEFLALGEMLFE
ncbi:hypothetical protein PSPO01_01052 [Paraphaeosphaeria sporulosa]